MKKLMLLVITGISLLPLTGRDGEGRFNLWPLVGYDNGALDVIWPLGRFEDSGRWWFFPVCGGGDSFVIFPEFWFLNDSFAVLPYWSKYDFSSGTLFPLLWWNGPRRFNGIFPLYHYHGDRKGTTFYSIPYSRIGIGDGFGEGYLCGLAGRKVYTSGETWSSWCFPLWYRDSRTLLTLPLGMTCNGRGKTEAWISPLLLSGSWKDGDLRKERYLMALAGRTVNEQTLHGSSWLAPFYYANDDGTFITPLYGCDKSSQWCFPLWYRSQTTLLSLLWCQKNGPEGAIERWAVPLLLSGGGTDPDGSSSLAFLLGLGGMAYDRKTDVSRSWTFPLYYADSAGGFNSLLYGRHADDSCTCTWWATPLVGTRSDGKSGGWFFPFFNRKKDAAFDRDLARLDSETMPVDAVDVHSKIEGSALIISKHNSSVIGGPDGKGRYLLTASSNQGSKLVFNRSSSRKVTYDVNSGKRLSDRSDFETTVLSGLFHRKCLGRDSRTRILWKLWDREEKDGNVTVDAFPGFTYDSRKDGYSKTSFLWRLFRYEKDPKEGTKCDVLFIPVLR